MFKEEERAVLKDDADYCTGAVIEFETHFTRLHAALCIEWKRMLLNEMFNIPFEYIHFQKYPLYSDIILTKGSDSNEF